MTKYRFHEKYDGVYTKEFQTIEEYNAWVDDHYEIYDTYELVGGKWVQL
jgi:hypothetical protein